MILPCLHRMTAKSNPANCSLLAPNSPLCPPCACGKYRRRRAFFRSGEERTSKQGYTITSRTIHPAYYTPCYPDGWLVSEVDLNMLLDGYKTSWINTGHERWTYKLNPIFDLKIIVALRESYYVPGFAKISGVDQCHLPEQHFDNPHLAALKRKKKTFMNATRMTLAREKKKILSRKYIKGVAPQRSVGPSKLRGVGPSKKR